MLGLLCLSVQFLFVCASSIKYDQSQHGSTNVLVDVSNLEVVAILDDSSAGSLAHGEYDYDYSELTLRPPANSSSSSSNYTTVTNSSSIHLDEINSNSNSTLDSSFNSTSLLDVPPQSPSTPPRAARPCAAGFIRDTTGRCRRLRKPPRISLTDLVTKLQGS